MKKANPIWLASPHMSRKGWEKFYVQQAFDKNYIAPAGENIDCFEEEFRSYVKANEAVAVSSGTAAIHLALKNLGIKKGDKVLCSSFTFIASCNPIVYEGATPIFIDSELDTWNMDPEALREALEKHPEAKAVVLVHLYGIPAKLKEILAICESFGVPLIEDAAEALGSTYQGKMLGTFGCSGIFSFNGNKIITTSGGGMLVTDSYAYAQNTRFLATQAREEVIHYEHREVGYNYRMSNVSAGIGRGQLKVLQERVKKKRKIFQRYKQLLSHFPEISFMPQPPNTYCNHWLSCVLFEEVNPRVIMAELAKENIESRPLWKPMHLQPVFQEAEFFGEGHSKTLYQKGLCLPSDTKMRDSDLIRVTDIIKKVLREVKDESSCDNYNYQYN